MTATTPRRLALVGNPNCGKTALFNQMTGSRQKVANYAGVTVERKEGRCIAPSGQEFIVLDLPGAYSLQPTSPDEAITRDICKGHYPGEAAPDALLCVVDATNLRLNLRFVLELFQLRRPVIVALNMMDVARQRGMQIDRAALERELGVPVIETIAISRQGVAALMARLDQMKGQWPLPPDRSNGGGASANDSVAALHQRVRHIIAAAVALPDDQTTRRDDALDRWILHPIFGVIFLFGCLFIIFQAVYGLATPLSDAIKSCGDTIGQMAQVALPAGPLNSLIVNGVVVGISTVAAFLPQILILFAFILFLEESGYLTRAAFLLDRVMRTVGLSGRSLIPLLSSFACAVPGIMATRSIQDSRSRWITIIVAPLMTCSARLPVYALLIGAFIPAKTYWNLLNLQGFILFGLYGLGIVSASLIAWSMKHRRSARDEPILLLELPPYRLPRLRNILMGLVERCRIFFRRVSGIILAMTVLLWFLLSYPQPAPHTSISAIDASFAGRIGHLLVPLFAPLGFNWQICVALIPGIAAREVVVSSLATAYALSSQPNQPLEQTLSPLLQQQWSLATAMSLLVWYVYAPMCFSTLAVIRRETGSWKQAGLSAFYQFALAYVAAWLTYTVVSFWLRGYHHVAASSIRCHWFLCPVESAGLSARVLPAPVAAYGYRHCAGTSGRACA